MWADWRAVVWVGLSACEMAAQMVDQWVVGKVARMAAWKAGLSVDW